MKSNKLQRQYNYKSTTYLNIKYRKKGYAEMLVYNTCMVYKVYIQYIIYIYNIYIYIYIYDTDTL